MGAVRRPARAPTFVNGTLSSLDALRLGGRLLFGCPVDREEDVGAYQAAVSRALGVRHVFPLGAGRMALYVLLKALGLGAGDEIVLPGYTCVVMPNAVRFAGCTNVFVDISLTDLNMDPRAVDAAMTPRTRAVLMQHTFGIPANIPAIRDVCRRRDVFLIEDGAHALGAAYAGKPVGHWGDAAVFSSESSKMISTDKGGLLVTNDGTLAERISRIYAGLPIRSIAAEKLACLRVIDRVITGQVLCGYPRRLTSLFSKALNQVARMTTKTRAPWFVEFDQQEYEAELDGERFACYPRRLSGILCALGAVQMQRLEADVHSRNRKASLLAKLLPRFGAVVPEYDRRQCLPSFVKYPFLVERRPDWIRALGKIGLPTTTWLNDPLHPRETRCHDSNGYKWGSCPKAEFASQHVLNLPVGRTVSLTMLRRLEGLRI